MKQLLMISAIFLTFQAQAEIFKCKNDNGKITYQGTPCLSGTVGKIDKAPDVPIEVSIRVQARLNNIKEQDRQNETAIELEQQQKEENERKEKARVSAYSKPIDENAHDKDTCAKKWDRYNKSGECWAPYRNAYGTLKWNAFNNCGTGIKYPTGCPR